MSCESFQEDLSALRDGELAPEREAAVRAHVAGCPRCAEQLDALGRVDALLARTPLPEVPAALRAAVLRGPGGVSPRRAPTRRRRWLGAPAFGVAAAAAAALALYLGLRPRPEAEAPGEPIAVAPAQAPEPEIPAPAPPPREVAVAELEEEPVEDLALALVGAEQPEDFDVIAHLEILERLLALEEGRG